jgi:hypothetical protein
LKVWAQKLGIPEAAQLLDKTLHEEKDADENLSALMVSEIHVKADNQNSEHIKRHSAPRRKASKRELQGLALRVDRLPCRQLGRLRNRGAL